MVGVGHAGVCQAGGGPVVADGVGVADGVVDGLAVRVADGLADGLVDGPAVGVAVTVARARGVGVTWAGPDRRAAGK